VKGNCLKERGKGKHGSWRGPRSYPSFGISWESLICKFIERQMVEDSLNSRLQKNWKPIIDYNPEFHIMACGWLRLLFRIEEDARIFLSRSWFWGTSFFSLKPWHAFFDLRAEFCTQIPIWVKYSGLPLEFQI
jgi:hypothetical protein